MPLYQARVIRHELTDTISLDIYDRPGEPIHPDWEVVTVVTDVELFTQVDVDA